MVQYLNISLHSTVYSAISCGVAGSGNCVASCVPHSFQVLQSDSKPKYYNIFDAIIHIKRYNINVKDCNNLINKFILLLFMLLSFFYYFCCCVILVVCTSFLNVSSMKNISNYFIIFFNM